jgi:hypothetical protein
MPKNIVSTENVATQEKCSVSAARKWAAANGVQFIGSGYHKNYLWAAADIERFKARGKPGRRWPAKEIGKN